MKGWLPKNLTWSTAATNQS